MITLMTILIHEGSSSGHGGLTAALQIYAHGGVTSASHSLLSLLSSFLLSFLKQWGQLVLGAGTGYTGAG